MGKNEVKVTFASDTRSLEMGLKKLSIETGQTQSKFQKFATGAKIVAGVALGGIAIAAKNAFEGLKSGQAVSAQTAAVLKSTGNAAGVTQGQIEDLALAISKKSGVDDEMIQKGQNLLLTFTNLRNEAGKGNDIFNQTTRIMTDMSVALGQDTKSSALQLGKALNDPVKGVTALSRVGVSFTEAQKKQIKAMVEAGDTAGAQKVILAELRKEFGGSADAAGKTLAGQIDRAKQAFDRASEAVLTALLPALTRLAEIAVKVTGFTEDHTRATKIIVGVIGGLSVAVLAANGAWKVYTAATKAAKLAQIALNVVMRANPIGLVITALVALGVGLVLAYKKSETFRNIVNGAFNAVKKAGQAVLSFFKGAWGAISSAISGPFRAIVGAAKTMFGIHAALFNAAKQAVSRVGSILKGLGGAIAGVASSVYGKAVEIGKKIISGMVNGVSGLGSAIKNKVEDGLRAGLGKLNPFSPVEHGGEIYIGEPIVRGAIKGTKKLKSEMKKELESALKDAISSAKDYVEGQGQTLMSGITGTIDAKVAKNLNWVDTKSQDALDLAAINKTLKDQAIAKEKARLEDAIAKAKTDKALQAAQEEYNTWDLEQQKDVLEQQIQARKDKIQEEAQARKDAAEQSITDLTDAFNRGLISGEKFNQDLVKALQDSGVNYQDVGAALGDSFARGFKDAIQGLQYEAARIPELLNQQAQLSKVTPSDAKKKAAPKKTTKKKTAAKKVASGAKVVIQNMTVRHEGDIHQISSQLARQLRMA